MAKREKRMVQRRIDVDTQRLFAGTLPETIAYLEEVRAAHPDKPGLGLVEGWHGYEDNYFEFQWDELETDEEFARRLEAEEEKRAGERREAARVLQRQKDLADLERLKRKVGVL